MTVNRYHSYDSINIDTTDDCLPKFIVLDLHINNKISQYNFTYRIIGCRHFKNSYFIIIRKILLHVAHVHKPFITNSIRYIKTKNPSLKHYPLNFSPLLYNVFSLRSATTKLL